MSKARTVADFGNGITDADLPSGSVLQIQQSVHTDTTSTTSQTWGTMMTVNITPSSASSKIFVSFCANVSPQAGAYSGGFRLMRNSTPIGVGALNGNRGQASAWAWSGYYGYSMFQLSQEFLDEPNTTSQITYSLQIASGYSGYSVIVNRPQQQWNDTFSYATVPCTLTVMEIAG